MSGLNYPINELPIPHVYPSFPLFSVFFLSLYLSLCPCLSISVCLCLFPSLFLIHQPCVILTSSFPKQATFSLLNQCIADSDSAHFFPSYLQWASKRQEIPSFYMTSIVKRHKRRNGPVIVALLYPGNVDGFRGTQAPQGGKSRTSSNRCLYWSWVYHDWRAPSQGLAQHYHKHDTTGYVTLNDVFTSRLLYMN